MGQSGNPLLGLMSHVSRSRVLCLSCLAVRLQLIRRMLVPTPKGPHLPAFCDFSHPSSSPSPLSLACFLPNATFTVWCVRTNNVRTDSFVDAVEA